MKRTAVFISIAILFTALTSLIAYKGYLQVVADIEGRFNTAQLVMARHIGRTIEQLADNIKAEITIASLLPSIQKGDSRCLAHMQEIYRELRGKITYLCRLDENGRVTHVVPQERIREVEERRADFKPLITAPISYKGRPAGVIGAGIDLSSFVDRETRPGMLLTAMNGYAWAVDDRGRFIFHPEGKFIGRDAFTVRKKWAPHISFEEIDKIMREKMMKGESETAAYLSGWHRGQEGKIKKLIAFCPFRIEDRHYSLALVTPASEVTSLTGDNLRNTLLLIGIVILIGIICLLVILYIDRQRIKHLEKEKGLGKEIKDSEERYRTLIEEAFDGIFVQRGAEIVFANQRLHDMLGYRDGELIGMDHWLVYHPEYQEITRERAKARMRGEEVISRYEVKLQRKEGSWFYGEINAEVISFAGEPGMVVWLRDITERKQAEEELRKSEEKYRTILESIEDGYYEVDIAGNFTFFNDSLVRIVGYSEDELMGMNYRQYTPLEDTERMYQAFNRVFTTGKPLEGFDWELTRKDGSKIHAEVSVSLIRDSEGQTSGFRGVIRDITERVHLEKKIKESEERYRHLIEHANAGIVLVSGEYYVFANKKMSEMVGYTIEELTSTPFLEFIAPRDRQLIEERYRRRQRGEKLPKIYDFWMIRRDGTEICVETDASLTEVNGEIATLGVMRDITEKKRAEEELRESEEKYRTLADSSLTGVFIHQDSKYVFVNDRFAEMHGYEPEELLGKDHLDLIHLDQREIIRQRADRRLKGEEVPRRYEIKRLKKDGEAVWHEIMVSDPITYRGRPAIMGHEIDITERMQAEETLRYFKEYNEKIVASIPSSLLVLDRNLNIKSVNRTYLEIGRVKHEDVVGRNIKEVFPGHLLKEGGLLKAFEEVVETKEPCRLYGVRHTSSRHPEKILNFTVSGIRIAAAEEATLILTIEDVTERARLREEIRKSRDFMDAIFKTSVDIVVTTDKSGIITFANRAAENFLGYNEEELVGKHVSVLYDRGRERAKDMMAILTSGQELRDYRMRFLTREGKEIPISVSGSLLKDSQGRVIGTLGFVRDVSRLVEAEEELRKKNEELENFVYVVSHDLKSPIVSMQGFSSMLLNDYGEKLGEKGGRYIERIRANASRMEVLISDLLALSRVGRVVGAFKDVSSLEMVSRVCEALKSRIEENRVKVSISNDLPVVHCDEARIYQVFENLIVNAIKFTGDVEKPRIEIRHKDKGEFHQFCVKDNGIGIDPKYHGKIFEVFQRLKEIDDEEGTGIGLVIVERIVKNHGGKVWVESEKGKGATFYFTLPKEPKAVPT